jgi:pimeloyl-ACP methyl ester carboxylesterase
LLRRLLRLRSLTALPLGRHTFASVGAVATLLAITIGSPGDARAAAALEPCHGSSGVLCGTVRVDLDRRLRVPGSVLLHVEELPAAGQRGVLFLLAGGPGQAATRLFDLAGSGDRWRSLFPGYTLVTFDPRGTGESGVLRCQSLEDPNLDFVQAMARCADAIGPAVTAYATRDHAEDVEAVRSALGAGKIALFGASYGAKLALAYALAHPKNVERVLLDSVLAPQEPDQFARSMLRSMPRGLRSLCTGGFCREADPKLVADFPALANALQAKPLRKGPTYVDGQRLLSLAVDADVNGGVRAQLPTAVAEARHGRPGLLLRLASPRGRVPPDPTFSLPLYIATTCGDPAFPWRPETPLPERQQAYDAAVAALPSGTTGPFGRWAARMGIADYCSYWPPSGPGVPLAPGPLPDVPALVLSGGYDMRTPADSARAIARLFPHARLLLVPGIGHGVLASDFTGCAERAVHAWLGGARPASCPAVRPVLAPVGSLPRLLTQRVTPPRALDGIAATLRSAAASWYTAARGSTGASLPGLHGGLLSSGGDDRFTLTAFSDVNGVQMSGRLDAFAAPKGPLVQLQGTVRVTCRGGLRGRLTVSGGRLSGQLGGRRISDRHAIRLSP